MTRFDWSGEKGGAGMAEQTTANADMLAKRLHKAMGDEYVRQTGDPSVRQDWDGMSPGWQLVYLTGALAVANVVVQKLAADSAVMDFFNGTQNRDGLTLREE